MSQWVRTCLTGLASGSGPPPWSLASAPQRHSHVWGTSASTENGSLMVCPFGHRYVVMLRSLGTTFASVSMLRAPSRLPRRLRSAMGFSRSLWCPGRQVAPTGSHASNDRNSGVVPWIGDVSRVGCESPHRLVRGKSSHSSDIGRSDHAGQLVAGVEDAL